MISIVIPVYNAEKYLPKMLESVLNQSFKDIELILVNDGSTDSSSEICHAYAAQYACIRVYDRENHGVSATRNYGIAQATGDFVWLMDSDDILFDNALQVAVDAQQRSQADVVVGAMEMCFPTEHRSFIKSTNCELLFEGKDLARHYAALFRENYITAIWNKLIRRTVISENHLHIQEGLSMYEDYLFSMDILQNAAVICCIPDVLYQYMLRDGSSLSRSYKRNISSMFHILSVRISEYLKEIGGKDPAAWVSLNNLMVYLAYECVKNEFKSPQEPRRKMKMLLENAQFCAAMKQFRGYGFRYRAVHFLMKHRMVWVLFLYLKRYFRGRGK